MCELPLIRLDKREYNLSLQKGSLFMMNLMYYQRLESADLERSDRYDGSVPDFSFANDLLINGKQVVNPRFMSLGVFIKCFTQCQKTDLRMINNHLFQLKFNDDTKEAIEGFHVDSALIIASPSLFLQQLVSKLGETVAYAPVIYLSEKELRDYSEELLNKKAIHQNLSFLKNERFKAQQEFRVCVRHIVEGIDFEMPIQEIECSVKDIPYCVEIGEIKNSKIVPINTLLTDGIIFDFENDECFIREDE